MKILSTHLSFGGKQIRFQHFSSTLSCEMTASVYLPKAATLTEASVRFPTLYWLSGLTCTDENFSQKGCAQAVASELGIILVIPDTSPRGADVPDDEEAAYDFGLGAGFYLNATETPWQKNYQMYSYISEELPALVEANFPIDAGRQSIFGHSMGGHGALTIALKNPEKYQSVSAFAPICSPINCPWGKKALSTYLGADQKAWSEYDAVALIAKSEKSIPMLIDQGSADDFLADQLKPELLIKACQEKAYPLVYNLRDGYDHSFFFISSFIESHLRFHHKVLTGTE